MRQEEVIHVLRCIGHPATTREVAEYYHGYKVDGSTLGCIYGDLQRTLKWGEIRKIDTGKRKGPHNRILWSVVE